MKHLIKNNEIIMSGIPSHFTRENGEGFWGGYETRTDIHYEDGWREEIVPEHDPTLQRLADRYYDAVTDKVTYRVIDMTVGELADRKESVIAAIENSMDVAAIKKLLAILTRSLLESPEVKPEELAAISTIYPQYRAGKAYLAGEVFATDGQLYRAVQAHTSQADWLPASTPALYAKFAPAGQVSPFVQPTGAHDAYKIGDRVSFNGSTYESLINANVYSPSAYPAGWKKL